MRLVGNCKCDVNITFETDMKDDRVIKCFRCGTEVKLQNRSSIEAVKHIIEENDNGKEETPKKQRKIRRKGF